MEDSQCVPCHLIVTLYQKQNIWKQLPQTTTWITRRRRSIQSGNYPQTPTKRKRIPILCEMERISDHWSDMGIWISLLRWWKLLWTLSSLPCAYHAFLLLFFIYDQQVFTTRQTCLFHMFTSFLLYILHVFASRLTHVLYLVKSVVRQLYSLAFHWEFYCSKFKQLNLRQYLATSILSVFWTRNQTLNYLTVEP